MDVSTALKLLGLGDAENLQQPVASSEIEQANQNKLADLEQKVESAPTDALKKKFQTTIDQVNEAAQFLLSLSDLNASSNTNTDTTKTMSDDTQNPESNPNNLTNTASRSSLSQTKLADLPGMSLEDSAQVELQPSQKLLNRYEVKELIGQGGMGAVYRVYDDMRDEELAIKVLLPSLTKNERALERFLNEAKISSKLSHTNIVNVYDVQKDGDLYFLTMELLEGQDLAQLVEVREQLQQPFSQKELLELFQQILPALDYAHGQTIHRDIKPENIWLDEEGNYKLMDFGIAQLQSTSHRTQTGAAMGTAYYMAPEQLKGSKNIDARADLYAIGVLGYALATGDVPAGIIKPLHEKRPDLDKGFCDAIMQCLHGDAEDRPQDANSLLNSLERAKLGKVASRPLEKEEGEKAATRVTKAAVVVLSLIVLPVVGVVYKNHLDQQARELAIEEERLAKQQKILNSLQLVSIPGGSFQMGSREEKHEQPIHHVSIEPFKMMAKEVTVGQFKQFVKATGYKTEAETSGGGSAGCYIFNNWKKWEYVRGHNWRNPGFNQTDNHPVVCVTYWDANEYAKWASKQIGQTLTLPSEAQWEYAARGGSSTKYHFGNSAKQLCQYGNVADETKLPNGHVWTNGAKCDDGYLTTAPVGQYQPNQFGLYDMHGNVREWTQDCWNDSYNGAPSNGKAWKGGECGYRVVRGGSWFFKPVHVRSAYRVGNGSAVRDAFEGFRLVQGG